MDVIGVDISKADFHVCLLRNGQQIPRSFPNNRKGYQQVQNWLRNRGVLEYHACMEATGGYWMGLATALFEGGARVSVVNPARTAMYARSQLRRTKTDKVDAEMIAQFCQTQSPEPWSPPAPELLDLRALLSYRNQVVEQRIKLKQIVKDVPASQGIAGLHATHLQSVEATIEGVDDQIRAVLKANPHLEAQVACLQAVKGFGSLTAVTIVARLPVKQLRNGKAAASQTGLSPSDRQSGTSLHAKARICKTGDGELRKALYMPAIVAMSHNPILAAFAARLRERGKPEKVIIVAVMRKLIVLAYELLKGLEAEKAAAAA